MKKILLTLLATTALFTHVATAADYKVVENWLKLPEGRPQVGNTHGDVAVSSAGEVYVSVMDPKAALQVYAANGAFLRNVPDAPSDFHGFVIRKQAPDGRMYHVAVWSGQEMIVWGGGDQQQGNFATGGRYHPTTHQWTPTANTNAPIGRGIATAIWTGEGMLIYGGSTGGVAAFNETYYYRPNRPSVAPNPAGER